MNLRQATTDAGQQDKRAGLRNQRGIALLTVMLMLLILTILGIASITVTSMENRMAGFFRTTEAVVAAADSCEGLAANIIQQTLSPPGVLPASFIAPTGPVPAANATTLYAEIYGFDLPSPAPASTPAVNYADVASTAPNFVMTNLPGFTVNGDIDLLYTHTKRRPVGGCDGIHRQGVAHRGGYAVAFRSGGKDVRGALARRREHHDDQHVGN
ncbi:MAG: hypothetical protein E8D43_07085 [Nitrospira sp.]|nr:MAG: hypothetical protein E8D43_07085 [Nitrospira sp.]